MDTIALMAVVAVGAVAWYVIRAGGRSPKGKSDTTASPRNVVSKSAPISHHWPSLGDFDFEIVGESHYQSDIARLAGEHGLDGARKQCIAELVPEDTNRHDPKAVAVLIAGSTVGYLTREDARSFRRRLGQKGLTGQITTCDALIIGGGTRKNGEQMFYGVRLDIKSFE